MMKEYELLYIVPSQFTDEEIGGIQSTIGTLIEGFEGKVLRNENLGKIKLAYTIKNVNHGSYILVHFNVEGAKLAELDRKLRLTDEVLRHMISERKADALEKKFEISAYVAPLSEEGRTERKHDKHVPKTPAAEEKKTPEKAAEIAPPAPADAEESKMSMEELDQKLDKILDGEIEKKA
ncbi:MAG: 30S ribosomal protein S6 [bacterium]|jgi:small subunit ribosomal protein S6|nr:30S ribosomal protein S6 [bacterium]